MVPSATKPDPHPLARAGMVSGGAKGWEEKEKLEWVQMYHRGTGRGGLGWESGVVPRSGLGAGGKRTMPGGSIVL